MDLSENRGFLSRSGRLQIKDNMPEAPKLNACASYSKFGTGQVPRTRHTLPLALPKVRFAGSRAEYVHRNINRQLTMERLII
jgi:hypothetical protein